MPDWAIPSGFFGIGLHSVFEMCRDVVIKSKQYDNQGLILKVDKRKNQLPTFFIEKFKDSWFSGTEITFTLQQKKFPTAIKSFGNAHNIARKTDPLTDDEIPIIAEYISGYIQTRFSHSLVKIQLNGSNLWSDNNNYNDKKEDTDPFIMDINSGLDFSLEIRLKDSPRSNFYYKGMICEGDIEIPGVFGVFNLFSKDTQYWLTMDRKKILYTRYDELQKSISEAIGRHHEIIYERSDNKAETALYLNYIHNCHYQDWKDYEICNNMTLDTILRGEKPLYLLPSTYSYELKPNYDYYITTNSFLFELLGILVKKEKKQFAFKAHDTVNLKDIIYNKFERKVLTYTVNFTESDQLIDLEIIKDELQYLKEMSHPFLRNMIPCYKLSYREISISEKNIPSGCYMLIILSLWFDDFLFLPTAKEITLSQELDIIFNFYKSKKILKNNLSEDDFKRMYKDMWYEIGMIDESDRIITF